MSEPKRDEDAVQAAQPRAPLPSPYLVDIQLRFSDTDRLGHVNNAKMATFAELGRLEYLGATGADLNAWILARLVLDFRQQVHLGQKVQVASSVRRIGNTSITLEQKVLADGAVAADIESVIVRFDYASQRPVPVPEAVRRQLLPDAP